ncbi:hypothetical protein PR048_002819 [Dryococelus australis]|uniref:Uncharacterized protein n=1 Tax=Dryococelus australis TaxID=614101 RepID=A0ABQ9INJ2_9NEOP|nr:hypothetical protein PR048_002819 [Dryococelus australis]
MFQMERTKLYCPATQEQVTELSLTPNEYLTTLLSSDSEEKMVPSTQAVCIKDLRSLQLNEQVKAILREGEMSL